MIGFEHIAQKVVLGIKGVVDSELGMKVVEEHESKGKLVVSGGVASNQTFRKMCLQFGNTSLTVVFDDFWTKTHWKAMS